MDSLIAGIGIGIGLSVGLGIAPMLGITVLISVPRTKEQKVRR